MRKKIGFPAKKRQTHEKFRVRPVVSLRLSAGAGAFYVRSAGAAGCGSAGSAFHASTTFFKTLPAKAARKNFVFPTRPRYAVIAVTG